MTHSVPEALSGSSGEGKAPAEPPCAREGEAPAEPPGLQASHPRPAILHLLLLAIVVSLLLLVAGCTPVAPSPSQPTSPAPQATTSAGSRNQPPTAAAPTGGSAGAELPDSTAASGAASTPVASSVVVPSATIAPRATSTAVSTPTPPASPTPRPLPSPTATPARFSGADATKHVEKLAGDIGSRPSGSASLRLAADYLRNQLASMGYDAQLQPYAFSSFQERSVQLTLQQPEVLPIAARTFVYSGSGSVEGLLVNCGIGRPADFPTSGLQGKVALIARDGTVTFQEKVANAVSRGAAAVVIYNNRNAEFRGSLGGQATVPVVGILQDDGQRLLEYVSKGPTSVSLKVEAATESRQGNNVVASAPMPSGRKTVVVGAHYDSVSAGPGANDNASGVATLLEVASIAGTQSYPFELVFVAFGDEEVGLVGSRQYVESLTAEEKARVIAMVNLDMVGVGDRMEFGGDGDLVNLSLRIARQMGYPAAELSFKAGTSSDHASFADAGIPAVFFHRTEDANYHTKLDTADRVKPEHLEAAGKVALRLLEELAKRS